MGDQGHPRRAGGQMSRKPRVGHRTDAWEGFHAQTLVNFLRCGSQPVKSTTQKRLQNSEALVRLWLVASTSTVGLFARENSQ